ncbi:uncharacterized protein FOMMEDRAFT_158927 [Fomitiporia mediterranea MF3/22]|uniref:uncharacterized protein n=1 Tax=Fomitiporia mediterranea (strain MF3/22) TaxID=694068 RepID=UPI0004409616|nr:uncharacterized protein FOMMEDRAFT_158927 [Fomitiporia mediterranea MF3/22]EJD01765.1 hypothetical protein FOMMEDRAFT_158927 [Fomitiporia mediterranea MF3/22]
MSSCSAAQATIDEHTLATMSLCNHSQGAILSPTPRALSFPTHHSMLVITLDGPTPRAFTFPSAVHDSISNGSSGPPLTLPEPSPSTPFTSLSPFEPSMQRARTDTALPAAQISSSNAPDLNLGAPLTFAVRRCGAASASTKRAREEEFAEQKRVLEAQRQQEAEL